MLELLREKNLDKFINEYSEKSLEEVLKDTLEYNSYRNYHKIDSMGNISTKKLNMPLVSLTFFGKEELENYFTKGLYITEKRRIHKIDRLSQYDVSHLEKNLYKIFYNRDLSIAYRYAKEFILKDKELFIKKLSHFVLLDEIKSEKAIITLAFIVALEKVNKENVDVFLYSYLPYIVTYPSHICPMDNKEIIKIDKENLDLRALSYLNLIAYGYEDYKEKYLRKLSSYIKDMYFKEEEIKLMNMLKESAK